MRIVVFSGTTEGRDFSRAAAALGIAVTVSVATDLGAEEQGQAPGITVHSGRLLPGAMAELLQGGIPNVVVVQPFVWMPPTLTRWKPPKTSAPPPTQPG